MGTTTRVIEEDIFQTVEFESFQFFYRGEFHLSYPTETITRLLEEENKKTFHLDPTDGKEFNGDLEVSYTFMQN